MWWSINLFVGCSPLFFLQNNNNKFGEKIKNAAFTKVHKHRNWNYYGYILIMEFGYQANQNYRDGP